MATQVNTANVIPEDTPMDTLSSAPLATREEKGQASRSRMYGLLADFFRYPDPDFRQEVRKGSLEAVVTETAADLPFPFPLDRDVMDDLRLPEGADDEEMEVDFIRLFDAGPGKPVCPLVEGLYRRDRKAVFKELIQFYNHFGLSYGEGSMEDRPDHICYEMECLHYLAFLSLVQLQEGKEVTGSLLAQRDFLARHPRRWIGALAERIDEIAGGLKEGVSPETVFFYRGLIKLTHRFIETDYQYLEEALAN